MSNGPRFIAALGAVLFALLGLSACGGIPGNAVVQVGSNPITTATFDHWMKVAAASTSATSGGQPVVPEPPDYTACIAHLTATAPKPEKGASAPTKAQLKTQCEQQYKTMQSEVLGFLISSEWVIGEGSDLSINLTDAEVKKQFAKIKAQQFPTPAEFEKFLRSSGQTVSDLLLRVKLNMLSQKIQQHVVKGKTTVTLAEIEKYYASNKARFGTPEKRSVRIVLTKDEAAAAAAKKEIESGKSFASVAKRVSIDPTSKANGGLLPEVVKGQEEKALDEAIFTAKTKTLLGPVKTPFGYYVFQVEGTTPGTQHALAQVQASIRSQLVATRQQAALSKFVKEFKTKWQAQTECREGYVVSSCKEYKATKTTTTATP